MSKHLSDFTYLLKHDKITQRKEGISEVRTYFARDRHVRDWTIQGGEHAMQNWIGLFKSLLDCAEIEKVDYLAKNSAPSMKRLADAASTVRWLAERAVGYLDKKAAQSLYRRIPSMLVSRNTLVQPLVLDLVKTVKCIAAYKPHLESMGVEDWQELVRLCFNAVLKDSFTTKLEVDDEDGKHPYSRKSRAVSVSLDSEGSVENSLYVEGQEDEDELLPTKKRRKRNPTPRPTMPTQSSSSSRRRPPSSVAVDAEQVAFMDLLCTLMQYNSSPVHEIGFVRGVLRRLEDFLKMYPSDSSLHHDFLQVVLITLDHVSLNRTQEVVEFAQGCWQNLLGLWGTKNRMLKEGLVCILRILFPYLAVETASNGLNSQVENIRNLWKLLIGEVDTKWGIEALSMDSLRLELLESVVDIKNGESAFVAKTFRAGPRFDPPQALTWAVLELQADCAEKLFQYSESVFSHTTPVQDKGKRQRVENPLQTLLNSLSSQTSTSLRAYHLQILLFFINRHWSVLHDAIKTDMMTTMLQLVSYDDGQGVIQSWTFLCFAAIANAENAVDPKKTAEKADSSEAGPDYSTIWDQVWTHAIRRTNVPAVCRAASHTAQALLVYVNSRSRLSFALSPLPNHRVLSEIENLAKDLDVQGPASPYDSVCAFLSHCLRIASQDVRLFRMQLEDKVLSWLVDCWRLEHVGDSEGSLHAVKDIALLLETICSCSRRSSLVCTGSLPECPIVRTLVQEEKTRVIREFLLYAKLPPFERTQVSEQPKENANSQLSSIPSDADLVGPRVKERKISSSLVKSLESLNNYWQNSQNANVHARATSVREALDVAVTALSFESILVLNGVRCNRSVIQAACKLIRCIVPLLNSARWTAEERALVLLGLEPLTSIGTKAYDDPPWVAMVPPCNGTGIRSRILKTLKVDDISLEHSLRTSRLDHLKVIWQNKEVQDTFAEARQTIMTLIRIVAGENPAIKVGDGMDIDDQDGFAPIRTSTAVESASSNESEHAQSNIALACIRSLAVVPIIQNGSGEPTRDKELTEIILDCAKKNPDNFLVIGPIFVGYIRNETLSLSAKNVQALLEELGGTLRLYVYSRDDRFHLLVIMFLEAIMHLWILGSLEEEARDLYDDLLHWLLRNLQRNKLPCWITRDNLARLLDKYLELDPYEKCLVKRDMLPSELLAQLNSDDDVRVRFRAASLTARMIEITRQARESQMELYDFVRRCYTTDLHNSEHMLTRILSLGNIMVISSAVRRGPYWHLVESCFFTSEYTQHTYAVLDGVVQRIGVKNLATLFEAYASQLANSIRMCGQDILALPPRILGYRDRRECAKATFHAFTPTNVLPGKQIEHGLNLFASHCKVLGKEQKQGLQECFGDIVGHRILHWLDNSNPVEELVHVVTKAMHADDYSEVQGALHRDLDRVIVSMLRTLWDQDVTLNGPIVTCLQTLDRSGEIPQVFLDLNKYRQADDFEPHEPNLPVFSADTILRGLSWLMDEASSVMETTDVALTYHVLQALLSDVQATFLLNEQFRLINAITLWVAYRHADFRNPTLLHTLIRGGCALLEQSDLVRSAQSLLDWCFGLYFTLARTDRRFPDVLIRISGQCYEYSQDIHDTELAAVGRDLLTWIDDQLERLAGQEVLADQLRFALSAWPHQPSSRLSHLDSGITADSISRVLRDSHLSSNRFRLVRQLRHLTSQGLHDRSRFAESDFWRLKECIPHKDQLRLQDVHDFALLLELNKGSISSFGNEQLFDEHSSEERTKLYNQSPEDFILQSLLMMLESEDAVSRHSAYHALRSVLSASSELVTGPTQNVTLEYQEEMSYLQKYCITHAVSTPRPASDISLILSSEPYMTASMEFSTWTGMISTLLTEILSTSNPFYAHLSDILKSQATFAELILPRLVQTLLQTSLRDADPARSCSSVLSEYFSRILSSEDACTPCRKSIIDTVLHLRHIPRSENPLAYNKWLDLDFSLLARNAITCGAYTTALLFLELASEYKGGSVLSDETTEKVMYEIYSNIDEPDGFYGIQTQDHYQFLMKRFHHEKQWDKAFRFHGAALEADMGNASETEGLLNAFQSYGFNHLATQTLLSSMSNQNVGSQSTMTYQLGWRTETWDLPDRDEESPGASLYLALRALHRERDQHVVDRVIEHVLFREMEHLRSLGSENVSQIRQVVQNLMSLSQVSHWRDPHIQSLVSSRQTDVSAWSGFMKIESGFEFSDVESIMATRISLVRSAKQKEKQQQIGNMVSPFGQVLVEVEKNCLLTLSGAARDAQQVQIALNSILQAKNLEKIPSFRVSEELAAVLWMHQEPKHAVEFLKDLLLPLLGQGSTKSDKEPTDVALATARLGSWTAEACLEKPSYISQQLFRPAIALLDNGMSDSQNVHAKVYHEYAIFAERQYYAILKSPDALRWRVYTQRKEQEIKERDSQLATLRTQVQNVNSKEYKNIFTAKKNAEKLLEQDRVEVEQFSKARDEFLKQAIEMYSRCLHASDAFDEDVPIRFCSLWLANFNKDRIQRRLQDALGRIASKKFVFLAHQLSARLSSQDSPAQKMLQAVILRMCREHPFHILYQVFCLKPLRVDNSRRQSNRLSNAANMTASQTERSTAALNVFDRLRNDPVQRDRVLAVEELCRASLEFANLPIKGKKNMQAGKSYKVPLDQLLLKLDKCRGRVPVITVNTPIDPSMVYSDCVWIDKYADTFETAGGINLPKIIMCTDMDGKQHKQLFKGEESDDLRQDAVMEQVFELVNIVLRRDTETRRRNLSVRTYKVVPLDAQSGVLEFVGNTSPLRSWLSSAHNKYIPPGINASEVRDATRKYNAFYSDKNKYAEASKEEKLQHYLTHAAKFPPVMRHYFTEKHKTPISWFSMRLNYTRSVATTSIVGHILGLGDRHTSNILMDSYTGEVVHIDLGIAFDQGKLLPVPETVPFRLTRDMVDGMGISGTDGVFQRCAEETLRVLRDGSEVIMTVLEVFRHDPLHNWTVSEIKAQKLQQPENSSPVNSDAIDERLGILGISMDSGTAEEAADRALSGVARKLDKTLSVAAAVRGLVTEARDPANLSTIYHGWSPLY